jgi:SAM-dependent methyltransferase
VQLYPGAFFQVDPEGARQLHGVVRALAGGARRILDLYSGVGAYALMLAPGRERVVAVEEVRQACQAARAAAPANVEVIEGRVEELDLESLGRFDLAILNPARRGSDPGVLLRLARLADRAIYVSCGPETFARDLDCLATHGLRVAALDALDLFPQTAEVEAVALLERGRPLARFPVTGGHARPPWGNREGISGAEGRPERVVALVIGDPGERGDLPGGRWRRLGLVAGHGLLRLELESGRLAPALAALARRGHPLAVRHEPTRRFFAEKGWLVRPFVHVERAGGARAPLHGDLVCALRALRADDRLVARAGGPS